MRAKHLLTVVAIFMVYAMGTIAQANPNHSAEVGLDRSNLTWQTQAVQAATLQGIHNLGVQWFRDLLSGTSTQTNAAFVHELQLAKQNNLKFLATVTQKAADYDAGYTTPNNNVDFTNLCHFSGGSYEISKINLQKFSAWLGAQLDAVKTAGLSIDAFEIGNEDDLVCFNGDVPDGQQPTTAQLNNLVSGYAAFLYTAASIIHSPQYFPTAQIITFGMAHNTAQAALGYAISQPARILADLRSWNGVNYLDNAQYNIAGFGSHIYGAVATYPSLVDSTLAADAALAGSDKPFWITEWSVGKSAISAQSTYTRGQVMSMFYDALDLSPQKLGPSFFYAYSESGVNWGLVDASGNPLPEAFVISKRALMPTATPSCH